MHDLVIEDARIVDGTGAPARRGSVAVTGGRITAVGIGARRGRARAAERARPGPGPRLHRPAHPLRRAGGVGPAPHLLVVARHHHGGDGQLRGGRGPLPARGARGPHGRPRQRRGHPAGRHAARHRLGVGVLRRVHGRAGPPAAGHQRGAAGAAHAAAPLRARRGVRRSRGDGGGDGDAGPALRRGAGRGRLRAVHHHSPESCGRPGPPAGLPAGERRRAAGAVRRDARGVAAESSRPPSPRCPTASPTTNTRR